jgi:hypothetical protein
MNIVIAASAATMARMLMASGHDLPSGPER